MFMVAGAKSMSGDVFWPTLAGATVGGAVSVATTVLVERQRGKAAAAERHRCRLADARLAARVITLELRDVVSVLRVALQQTPFRWPLSSNYGLPVKAWAEYSGRLGAAVPDSVWSDVALPYSSFEYANLLGSVMAATAQTMLDEAVAAIETLERWGATISARDPATR
jgi:hypothetical protein